MTHIRIHWHIVLPAEPRFRDRGTSLSEEAERLRGDRPGAGLKLQLKANRFRIIRKLRSCRLTQKRIILQAHQATVYRAASFKRKKILRFYLQIFGKTFFWCF